jgi:hypothetical protein
LFFLLYLLPWHNLPSIAVLAPSPAASLSSQYKELPVEEDDDLQATLDQDDMRDISMTPYHEIPFPGPNYKPSDLGLVPYRAIVHSGVKFNASKSDILVLLHIQKTGGTSFEKHIVQDLDVEQPCVCWKRKKRCKCPRPGSNKGKQNFWIKKSNCKKLWYRFELLKILWYRFEL